MILCRTAPFTSSAYVFSFPSPAALSTLTLTRTPSSLPKVGKGISFKAFSNMAMAEPPSKIKQGHNETEREKEKEKERERGSGPVQIADYSFEGISVGGQETCIMVPRLKIAFDIGRCPQRAVSQEFLFISHSHMDHIGGIAMYVATRGLYRLKPPTVIVPRCIKETVEKLLAVYRELDGSSLHLNLVGLDVGEEYDMGKSMLVKPFKTYHVIPSQGYLIYSVRKKLKSEYIGLPANEIKDLKMSGVEITNTIKSPEIAFTGDTMADFIVDEKNEDVLKAKVLVMEATFVDDAMPVELAREYGHTHLSEVVALADKFENKGILFIHFSARYRPEVSGAPHARDSGSTCQFASVPARQGFLSARRILKHIWLHSSLWDC